MVVTQGVRLSVVGVMVGLAAALGLTRAFLSAGATRVLVSLGAVDDEATGALMHHFYELWKAGLPTACALRHAQAHVRSQEQWKHPYFWASWTLWGLPR